MTKKLLILFVSIKILPRITFLLFHDIYFNYLLNFSKKFRKSVFSVDYSASTITAMPWPPPIQAEPIANFPAFRLLQKM